MKVIVSLELQHMIALQHLVREQAHTTVTEMAYSGHRRPVGHNPRLA
jgi:hypothetical protein